MEDRPIEIPADADTNIKRNNALIRGIRGRDWDIRVIRLSDDKSEWIVTVAG